MGRNGCLTQHQRNVTKLPTILLHESLKIMLKGIIYKTIFTCTLWTFFIYFLHDFINFDAPIIDFLKNNQLLEYKIHAGVIFYMTYWWLLHCGSQPLDVHVGAGWVCDGWFPPSGVCPNFQTLCCSQYRNNYSLSQ